MFLENMKYIYEKLLKLDCAVLKSDNIIVKVLKRKLLKPIGFYFRKKYFNLMYK
jgi:hypothetical protein